MPAKYQYNVDMSCGACSNAINRVLSKMEGIESVDISLEKQTVLVSADTDKGATYEAVLEKIVKTGRPVKGGETLTA